MVFVTLSPAASIQLSLSRKKGVVDGERPLKVPLRLKVPIEHLALYLYLNSKDILRALQKTNSITS